MKVKKKITVKDVQKVFNEFIRKRDCCTGRVKCISCPKIVPLNEAQASHYYSAGKYNSLRFVEDNVHVSCLQCNYFEHGNLIEYRKALVEKIGEARIEKLDVMAGASKRSFHKWLPYELEALYNEYKQKIKNLAKVDVSPN